MTRNEVRSLTGLKRWSERHARIALVAWEASGLSANAFARESGICDQRLRWWRQRLGGTPTLLPVRVVDRCPSRVKAPTSGSVMEIVLVTDRRLRVTPDFDDDAVARLVRVLEDGAC